MKLTSPSKAVRYLPAARKRLDKAKREILDLCRAFRLCSGNVYAFANDIEKANQELKAAREWFGECFYQSNPELVCEDIENALRDARILCRDIKYLYAKLGIVDQDPIGYAVDTTAELRASREKAYLLLAEYAERWFNNG